jgi:aryl-alcohol dehydrogenase-like predicted oxidoreductase
MTEGPDALGFSRKAILTGIDASLRRLGTDYVDLYQSVAGHTKCGLVS